MISCRLILKLFYPHLFLNDFAQYPRIANIVGESKRSYVREFIGEDLSDISRVIVDVANPLTKTIAGRVQMADNLLQYKQITPDQYFAIINSGKLEAGIEEKESRKDYFDRNTPNIICEETAKEGEKFKVKVKVGDQYPHPDDPNHFISYIQLWNRETLSRNTIHFRYILFQDLFDSHFQGHLRHGAPAAGTREFHLNHTLFVHPDELNVAAVGLKRRPDLVEGLFHFFPDHVRYLHLV